MAGESATQWQRNALIEEDPQKGRLLKTVDRMKHGFMLLRGSSPRAVVRLPVARGSRGEPFEKFIQASASLEVLKQSPDRDPRALEEPLAAHSIRQALDCRTLTPIQHSSILGEYSWLYYTQVRGWRWE